MSYECHWMRFAHAQYVHLVVGWGTLESRTHGTVLRVESIAVDGDAIDEQLRVAARLRYRQSVPEGCARWTLDTADQECEVLSRARLS